MVNAGYKGRTDLNLTFAAVMTKAYLLLGGNKGNVRLAFASACTILEEEEVWIRRRSALYSSPPWGFSDPDPFLNQVLEVETSLQPVELLQLILQTEKRMGRKRPDAPVSKKIYSSRTIDIDILLYGDLQIDSEELEIPHPRLFQRRFALEPLAELSPGLIPPGTDQTIEQLLENCPDKSPVNPEHEV